MQSLSSYSGKERRGCCRLLFFCRIIFFLLRWSLNKDGVFTQERKDLLVKELIYKRQQIIPVLEKTLHLGNRHIIAVANAFEAAIHILIFHLDLFDFGNLFLFPSV